MSDTENERSDEDKLQRELEKQIGLFARLFAMLDTDSDGERQSALLKLTRNMERINELQEALTGTPGTLSFVTLLEKIENGGGGGQAAEYEQIIAEYQAANESLKQAETMLRAELERAQILQKYDKANKIDAIDLGALAKKTLGEVKASLDTLEELMAPAETPEGVEGLYNNVLDEMLGKDLGADGKEPRLRHRLFAGLIRGLNYPVDADDAVKLQTLAATQAQLLKDTEALQEKVTTLRESLPGLQEALDIAIFQSGEHPDFTRAIREMQDALRQVQKLRYENNAMGHTMARMRLDYDGKIHERDRTIGQQKVEIAHLDTRLLQLLNDIEGGKNPIAKPTAGGAADFASRSAAYRKDAIAWSSHEALRARITALAGRGAKVRAGSHLRPVTLADVLQENHALHAFLLRRGRDAGNAARQGNKILDSYRLLPRDELDNLVTANENLEQERNKAREQTASAQGQIGRLQQDCAGLQHDVTRLRTSLRDRILANATLENEKNLLQVENDALKSGKRVRNIFRMAAAALTGAALAGSLMMLAQEDVKPANTPVPAPQAQGIAPAP